MTTQPLTQPITQPRIFPPYTPPTIRKWELSQRIGTGQFIVSQFGTLLCRVHTASGLIYLWDKKQACEVTVQIRELFSALFVV